MTADDAFDYTTNLEGHDHRDNTFMEGVQPTLELLDNVLLISPAPSHDEYLRGSRDNKKEAKDGQGGL